MLVRLIDDAVAAERFVDALSGLAPLIGTAGDLVSDIGVGTAGLAVASVYCASIIVVTANWCGYACAAHACVAARAGIAVIADAADIGMLATLDCVTGICGADVVVIARRDARRQAEAALALVAQGALVSIVASGRDYSKNAAFLAVAAVGRAGIAVGADLGTARVAEPGLAEVAVRARIAVVAGQHIVGGLATLDCVAEIARAGIAVIAGLGASGHAPAALAAVEHRAHVAIATNPSVGSMLAALLRVAAVVGAGVAVVAADQLAGLALAARAHVAQGADAAVVTRCGVGRRRAADGWVATICCARVFIVAHADFARLASAACADVAGRTGIAVIAAGLVGRLHTTLYGVTGIGCARVAVVAQLGRTALADADLA